MKRVCQLLMISILILSSFKAAQAASYYVDSTSGSDSNSGISSAAPWQSLSKVNSTTFQAGDTINFKRGSVWTGNLQVKNSGTSVSPITYQAYGSGSAPQIKNPGVQWAHSIDITGDYNVVQDFLLTDDHEAGIFLQTGADHNIVQNNEMTRTGTGVLIKSQFNLITKNYAYDLSMIVNTVGGNDDYGAVGYWLHGAASNNEISYNKCITCRAPSFDYGFDGGTVEIFTAGGTVSNITIHHNYSEGTNGFMEFGGGGTVSNVTVSYNVIYNLPEGAFCIHDSGAFAVTPQNIKIEHNTFFKNVAGGSRMIQCMSGLPTWLTVRNNIFYTNIGIASATGFTHANNLYFMTGGATVGYTLDPSEKTGDPLFVNAADGDLRLQSGSPAVNAGTSLSYSKDYDGKTVSVGAAPDMGAYEYVGAITPSPAQHLRVIK